MKENNAFNKYGLKKILQGLSTFLIVVVVLACVLITILAKKYFVTKDEGYLYQKIVSESYYIYALGLQMGQAERNVVLDPSNEEGFVNYQKANELLFINLNQLTHYLKIANEFSVLSGSIYFTSGEALTELKKLVDIQNKLMDLSKNGKKDDSIRDLIQVETPQWREIRKKILTLKDKSEELAKQKQENSEYHLNIMVIAFVSGAVVLIIFSLVSFVATGIMTKLLTNSILSAKGVADSFVINSTAMSATSQSVSSNTTETAAALEETVASAEQISTMAKKTESQSYSAVKISAESLALADKGKEQMTSLLNIMNDVQKSSEQIKNIVSVIDDIAFQTNLLALNAAVEAARAGEQGNGFAVVAEAVRALAQQSSGSAKGINSLVLESVATISKGVQSANDAGQSFGVIFKTIQSLSEINREIAVTGKEQTTGISQITKAMNELDKVTQSNAASSEEAAVTSAELATEADKLHKIVSQINLLLVGKEG